ncbi:MAG: MarR family winged helix-turn-helix transcriptional regulator [Pirellulales bacterium]
MTSQIAISGLEEHVGYWLRYVSNHVSHSFSQKVEAHGVTVAEWVVLRELFDANDVSPSQIAERLAMTRGAISKLVERLCLKRLIKRKSLISDRRYQSIALTPEGRKLVPRLAMLADENDREFFGHLGAKDRLALVAVLKDCVARHGWKDLPVE